MTITTIDRSACRTIQTEALAALQAVASKYGLAVTPNSGTFSPSSCNVKFTFSPMVTAADLARTAGPAPVSGGTSGVPADFANKAALVGLKASDYGRVFTNGTGKQFKITGINLRGQKYPILATEVRTGKVFKFTEFMMSLYLGNKGAK